MLIVQYLNKYKFPSFLYIEELETDIIYMCDGLQVNTICQGNG